MSPYVAISGLFLLLMIKFLLKLNKHSPKLPPSPTKLPIIGNLHHLGSLPHRSITALSKKHGDLMLFYFGGAPTLVVSSDEMAREIMKTHDLIFSDRSHSIISDQITYHRRDIVFSSYGEYWRQVRKISVLHLLTPMRVESFRATREEEVSLMIQTITKSSGAAVNIGELLVCTLNNIISRVVVGRKCYDAEGSARGFPRMLCELVRLLGTVHIGDVFPPFAWVGELTGLNARLRKMCHEWDEFLERVIEEHQHPSRVVVADGGRQDFVDVLLDINKKGELGFTLERDSIKAILLDNFAAGTETTNTTMLWAMTELVRHPRVMKKVQQEVRKVVGGKERVTEDDISQMNYLKSVVKETLRMHPPLPLSVPRSSTQDVQIQGYSIPAKTRVLINIWAISRDPKSWEAPEEFWPERFEESNSKSINIDFRGHDFQFLPFGSGRRGCPGIQYGIATTEFLLANLMYWYDWELPAGGVGEEVDISEDYGITVRKKFPLFLIAKKHFQ